MRDKKFKSDFSTNCVLYWFSIWYKSELIFSGKNDWICEIKTSFAFCSYSDENNVEILVMEILESFRLKSQLHDFIAFLASEYRLK